MLQSLGKKWLSLGMCTLQLQARRQPFDGAACVCMLTKDPLPQLQGGDVQL